MTTPTTNPNESTATPKPKPIHWLVWYTFVILGLTILGTYRDADPRNYAPIFLYTFLGNWVLWSFPAWCIVRLVRWIRKK